MRVIALPADETGCGSYRVIWPAAMVANAHPDWTVEIYRPSDVKIAHDRGRLITLQGLDPTGADVVIMQRVGSPGTLALMRWLQERGVAVVLDADDALWSIHRDNSAYAAWNQQDGHHWSFMDTAAREADLVTVTTPRLADRYGKHGRVVILPNRVPAGALELRRTPEQDRALRFGWSGYVGTHPADLGVVGNAVSRVLAETPADALIIGDGNGILTAWGLREQAARVTATGSLPLDAYYDGLSRLDVGMVPLEESVFNRCKSGLKAAEFAAVGVPTVVTPTPAHTALAREGFPLLTADSPREWHEQLTRLLTTPEVRAQLSEAAFAAAGRHTLENHIEEWAETWQRAAVRRTRLSA